MKIFFKLPDWVIFRNKFGMTTAHYNNDSKALNEKQIFAMKSFQKQAAFSLVELLMALLVASLLMAALAPVMTRKMNENVTLNGNMSPAKTNQHIVEIDFGSPEYCPADSVKIDTDGSEYCEGEFTVKGGYTGYMSITVIGAGGGGGTAPTSGYTEYTNEGSTNVFTVPAMSGNIEATLVSGGGGGKTNSAIKTQTFVTYGNGNIIADENNRVEVASNGTGEWTVPVRTRGKDMLVTACGGGGGGGCTSGSWGGVSGATAYGGGAGGYITNKILNVTSDTFTYYIGGGGTGTKTGVYNTGTFEALEINTNGNDYLTGRPYGGGSNNINSACTARNAGVLLTSNVLGGSGGTGGNGGNRCINGANGGQPAGGDGGVVHWSGCYSGGGGGGGGASQIVTVSGGNKTIKINAPGGGGGASFLRSSVYSNCPANTMAGGGGGGGTGGGAGGSFSSGGGKGGNGTGNASGYNAGTVNTIFGNNYCNGGNGGMQSAINSGYSGKSGAIRLTYTDFTSATNTGGGAGSVINSIINTQPNENLILKLGTGGKGEVAAHIDTSDELNPKIINKMQAENGSATILYRDESVLANTGNSTSNTGTNGSGGTISLFNGAIACSPAAKGTSTTLHGSSAVGFGCGGGGAYEFSDRAEGGKGSGGYARISWNKYWDIAANAYKNAGLGAGGGGASGNIFKYNIPVSSNQIIKLRIGKGGRGAYVSNNTVIDAKKGGDTVFGDIKAGGGAGGGNSSVDAAGNTINGLGGDVSNVCHYKNTSYLNNKKCTKGAKGADAADLTGGAGAAFVGYSYSKVAADGTETKIEIKGDGGLGGVLDTGDNANGKNASGLSAGGGGASLRDLGKVNSSAQSNITNNPNKGGDGTNGKIIIEWWE